MKNAFIFIGGVALGVYSTFSWAALHTAMRLMNENEKKAQEKDDE